MRELLIGPRRFTDLCRGLPGIGTNILTARLKGLEQAGVVQRRKLPPPAATTVYELTDYGRELEEIILDLGRWGAKSMGPRLAEEHFTASSLALAMKANFQPEEAPELTMACEFRFGDDTFSTTIDEGGADFRDGASDDPDVVMETDPDSMVALLIGAISLGEAATMGSVTIHGDDEDIAKMLEVFRFRHSQDTEPESAT